GKAGLWAWRRTRLKGRKSWSPSGQAPDVQHAAGGMLVGVALGEDDLALQHDGAVPMPRAARQRGDPLARNRVVHVQAALARIDEQQAIRLERAGAAGAILP